MKIKTLKTEFHQSTLSELKRFTGLGLFHLVLIALCQRILRIEATKLLDENIKYWRKTGNDTIGAVTTRLNNKPEPEFTKGFYSMVAAQIFGVDIYAYIPYEVAEAPAAIPPIPKYSN